MLFLNSSPTLWEELWAYFEEKYFSVNMGNYEHLNLGKGTLLNVRNIIVGLFIGIIIASAISAFDKNHLGGLVRKLIHEECLHPEKAKTLAELGYLRSPAVRGSLKRGSVLSRVVHCVEKEAYDRDMQAAREAYIAANGSEKGFTPPPFHMDFQTAHFYIPDEEHYRAEIRFEKKGSDWRSFLLVVIVSVIGIALVCFLLPDILQLLDNMIGILKGEEPF